MSARDARTICEQSSELGALPSLAVNDTGNERAGRQRSREQVVLQTIPRETDKSSGYSAKAYEIVSFPRLTGQYLAN